jgi:hypothetical protein
VITPVRPRSSVTSTVPPVVVPTGLTIYATDETERFVYYYAHLNAYGHGIIQGTHLARGQVIGSSARPVTPIDASPISTFR